MADEDLPGYEATLTRKGDLADHLVWQLRLSALHRRRRSRWPCSSSATSTTTATSRMPAVEGESRRTPRRATRWCASPSRPGVGIEFAEQVLKKVQTLDPHRRGGPRPARVPAAPGPPPERRPPEIVAIIERHLKHLESKNYAGHRQDLKVPLEEVVKAVKVIAAFEPKPGRAYTSEEAQYITPDVYVHKMGDRYVTVLNDDGLSKLRISGTYRAGAARTAAPARPRTTSRTSCAARSGSSAPSTSGSGPSTRSPSRS